MANLDTSMDHGPGTAAKPQAFGYVDRASPAQGEPAATKTLIDGIAGLKDLVGKDLGSSAWRKLAFEDIVRFADATNDHQWIHVDRERIARESPFGVPIAHGYFSLSVISGLFFEIIETKGMSMVINYGLNKVRWPSPLKEGASYRLSCKLLGLKEVGNAQEATVAATVEIKGEAKPACVAEFVFRFCGD